MAVMETLGFAAFFRDRLVAAVGGAVDAADRRARRPPGDRWLNGRRVVVVGAGVGGLATAIRLAVAGHHVVVLERNDVVGGKLAAVRHDGFTFDVGPSLVTLPHVFDELFQVAGTTLAGELDLVRLDPQFRYRWPDGAELDRPGRTRRRSTRSSAFRRGAGAAWRRFDERGRRIWDVSERTFLAGPMGGPWELLRRDALAGRSAGDRPAADAAPRAPPATSTIPGSCSGPAATPPTRGRRRSGRRRRWRASRTSSRATAAGTRAAASTPCVARWSGSPCAVGVEMHAGVGGGPDPHPRRRRPRRRARSTGPCVASRGGRQRRRRARLRRPAAGPIGAAAGAAGRAARRAVRRDRRRPRRHAGHRPPQRVVLGRRPDRVRRPRGRADGRRPDDLRLRLVDDRPVAGAGRGARTGSCWSTPRPASRLDGPTEARLVLDRLAARGVDLRGRGCSGRDSITPLGLAARYRSPAGAIYGTSSNGRRAAFLRPEQPRRRPGAVPRRRVEPPGRRAAAGDDRAPASWPTWSAPTSRGAS